jgi:Asp-tRNA(Asn)/Glu-tRNA(Gln) amidotransferase A subunit family amidase
VAGSGGRTTELTGRAGSRSVRARPGQAARLASKVRAGKVSAQELVGESLRRIDGSRDLNAVTGLRADGALADARAVDAAIARGDAVGPLAGLPLLVKDTEDIAGLPTTCGSLLRRNAGPAAHSSVVPGRLAASGALVIGKTNVSEFAFEAFTSNKLFGATRNPWAPAWSPGGSSGGSAAALAAGLVPLATATDGGGSIRIPASACGLAGLKPTQGIVARDHAPTWIDLSTAGPLASSVADLCLLLSLEAGPSPGDPTAQVSWRLGPLRMPRRVFAAPRVVDYGPIDPSTLELFTDAIRVLERDLRMPIEPLEPAMVFRSGNPDDDFFAIAGSELVGALGRATVERALAEQVLEPTFAEWIRVALDIDVDAYLAARRRVFGYVRELDALLLDESVLVSPTLTVPGWTPDGVVPGREAEAPGLPADVANTAAFNLAGAPALSVPLGRHANGVPFGLQIVGPRYREDLVLGLGAALEVARPWPRVADGYEAFEA